MPANSIQCCDNCEHYHLLSYVNFEPMHSQGTCTRNGGIRRHGNWGTGCSGWELLVEEVFKNKSW